MGLTQARVLKASREQTAQPLAGPQARAEAGRLARARRLASAEFEAHERAAERLQRAEQEAKRVLASAKRQAADLQLSTLERTKADALASVAALAIKLKLDEQRVVSEQLEQCLQFARVLAERLLGAELRLHPERVVQLAEQVLREARGARHLTIHAHPDDIPLLRQLQPEGVTLDLRESSDLSRGDLLVDTEVGGLDARLTPRLDRLAEKLREVVVAG